MWDFIRCFMKIQGVHYDRYTPEQAAEIIAEAEAAGKPIPNDLVMMEAVVRLSQWEVRCRLQHPLSRLGLTRLEA
jgi:hypothetical protein